MTPLKIKARCVADADTRRVHIQHALSLNLQEFGPSPAHEHEVVIVGSGPSVKGELKKIRKLQRKGCYIIAVKGAHEFLLEHGIVPAAALAVDPQAKIKTVFKSKNKDITYFIASQCHPEVFEHLSDCRVVLFHLLMKSNRDLMRGKFELPGGSTSGLRAMVLAWYMGFRKFHLFGFDSCLTGKLRKITGEIWGEEGQQILPLHVQGKDFPADPAMASQAQEWEQVCKMLEGSRFKTYGEGLIPWIHKLLVKNGESGFYASGDDFSAHCIVRPKIPEAVSEKYKAAARGFLRGAAFV